MVITSGKPPSDDKPQCCSPKISRIICWLFVFFLAIMLICISFLIVSFDACLERCDGSPWGSRAEICYQNKNYKWCEFKCTYPTDYSDRNYSRRNCGAAPGDVFGDGRPFMIQTMDGEIPLLALPVQVDSNSIVNETDVSSWCSDSSISGEVDISKLSVAERLKVAKKWTSAALAEHASVASFSRFSLQLMAVGAPPSLLKEAHEAAAQEVNHAILCFDLAKLYYPDDVQVAPGEFPLVSSFQDFKWSLEEMLKATVKEGCIGETLAAISAAIRLSSVHSTNSRVKEALTIITSDEANHAALAWKTVVWALHKNKSSTVRSIISDTFSSYLPNIIILDQSLNLPTHGWWSDTHISALHVLVFNRIIRPWADALLAGEIPSKLNLEEQPKLNDILNVIYQRAFIWENN